MVATSMKKTNDMMCLDGVSPVGDPFDGLANLFRYKRGVTMLEMKYDGELNGTISQIDTDLFVAMKDNETIAVANANNETLDVTMDNSTDLSPLVRLMMEAKTYMTYKIGAMIHVVYFPILVPIGMVGNALSVWIMSRPHNRKISFCIYMGVLAVTDNCMLFIALYFWIVTVALVGQRDTTEFECKFLVYLFQVFSTYGVFVIISMTVDRFLAIRKPLKAPHLCTPKRAKIITLVLIPIVLIYNLPYYFNSNLINKGKFCAAFTQKHIFALIYLPTNVILNSIVPFVAILTMNIYIIKTIKGRHKEFGATKHECITTKKTNSAGQKSKICLKEMKHIKKSDASTSLNTESVEDMKSKGSGDQLIVMLLLVTFTFLVLTLPQYIRYGAYLFINYTSHPAR